MGQGSPSLLKAALIGGVVAGIVAAVPWLGDLLCLCCALPIWSGGFLAAFLYSKDCSRVGVRFDAGRGALVGLAAGPFYAVVHTVAKGLSRLVMGGGEEDLDKAREILEGMQGQQDMPPQALEMMEKVMSLMMSWVGLLLIFGFFLLIGAIFSTLGGLIGGAVFKVEQRPDQPTQPEPL